MNKLISIFFLLFIFIVLKAETTSPHGEKMKIECAVCHTASSWSDIKTKEFNHGQRTRFKLKGQHKMTSCKQCHPSLVFVENKSKSDCNSCHQDIHQGTVGKDCEKCHTSNSWIVTKIRQIHQSAGFVLVGEHAITDCKGCHPNVANLLFENIRTDCYSCHAKDYFAATKTDHRKLGFGTDCDQCHTQVGSDWTLAGRGFNHGYFPLKGGHAGVECDFCHTDGLNVKITGDCSNCHSPNNRKSPFHNKFPQFSCEQCHNIQSFTNLNFKQHDGWFQIYSGTHRGKWQTCFDCHSQDASYTVSCRKCHNFDR
jgi:hypothetical protein